MKNYRDIKEFIKVLKEKNLIVEIEAEVDWDLEITEITDIISKKNGKALLFNHVKGSRYPVLINTFGSYERMALALGVKDINDIKDEIVKFLDLSNYQSLKDKIKAIPSLLPLPFIFPQKVKNGKCQEVIEKNPDLTQLPVLKCWPQDGGRFITLPMVFTVDPETRQQNAGMYRMQVYDEKTTGMHWHMHKDGKKIYDKYRKLGIRKMPVSVAIGCDPATVYASTAPLPQNIDELLFSGFLRKKAVKTVKCITNDIYVPAYSEFILEGYVDIDETRIEGPFGDHTGYYSLKDKYPVFHVELITHQKEPVYMATVVGQPPMEDCYMGKATERIFLPLIKMQCPEIIELNLPLEGVFHNCAIVSIDKQFPHHARKIMNSLWGMGQMMYTKMIIVVDKDVNPHDLSKVMWKVFNNIDAKRDLVISEGPLDALDHSSDTPLFGNRLGIDATKKWETEGHTREWPDDVTMSDEIIRKVKARWGEYGID
ncbi:MAG: menaquinone biosynthesis decarboxylase [Clostridia bacterium]|nr:menaquinone biosynthesis decarboxylase [Clostridia bacterium]